MWIIFTIFGVLCFISGFAFVNNATVGVAIIIAGAIFLFSGSVIYYLSKERL